MRAVTPRPRLRAGERRHLTVLFCDIVNSTRLAEQFDPEDWVDIVTTGDTSLRYAGNHFQQNWKTPKTPLPSGQNPKPVRQRAASFTSVSP